MLTQVDMHPNIELDEDEYPIEITGQDDEEIQENHDRLLSYLLGRIDDAKAGRQDRVTRFAKTDKTVSTWQRLTEEDAQRKNKQENTGQAQAIAMNIPLAHTHLDDMVALFANIYSPSNGSFFQAPSTNAESREASTALIDKLNGDAKFSQFYTEICKMMRSILKYNVAGFHLMWSQDELEVNPEDKDGKNNIESLDMYNTWWDPSIKDPSRVAKEAEWGAMAMVKNRRYCISRNKRGFFTGVGAVINKNRSTNGMTASYYRDPPASAGINWENDSSSKGGMDWKAYGASLVSDGAVPTEGYEIIKMYCWLNPNDFGLEFEGDTTDDDDYVLWQFWILDGKRIVRLQPAYKATADAESGADQEIPMYMGNILLDDMGDSQRSIAELLAPFQSYGSFLINADVAGTRSSIWGLKGYDPSMFDIDGLNASNGIVGWLKSKIPGRDVRAGLMRLDGDVDTSRTMEKLSALLNLMREFFPSQALPNQIAGMDRAVQSQVAAVLQGVNRRLHMLVRVLDDSILGPLFYACWKNIAENQQGSYTGLTDPVVRQILGSGLKQLDREAAEQAIRQLLFAIIQNPQSAQGYDIPALMGYWGQLLNSSINLSDFKAQQPVQPGTPPAGTPAQVPPDPNAAAAGAAV